MADTSASFAPQTLANPSRLLGQAFMRLQATKLFHFTVACWVFFGGIILFEPSFYELSFVLVLLLALLTGMKLFSSTIPLLMLIVPFAGFGLIAAFQVRYTSLTDSFIFVVVTIFLLVTTYFTANFVAEAPHERVRLIRRAYVAIAVISAAVGILAYLGLVPGAEMFLRYDRAKGMFKDPNVYGPFLVLPAMFVLRDLLFARKGLIVAGTIFMLLLIGVFVSFSRAAWGHFAVSAVLVLGLSFFLEAYARDKVRILILSLAGLMVVLVAFAGLLSIPVVANLFEQRASATQDYDTGETGRFGRQGYAFELALANPLGLGPTEFGNFRIREQPHNSYVTVIQAYGWGGGACYYLLVLLTLWRGLAGLQNRATRPLLIPVIAVFIPLAVQSGLIDTDHWRHYFLVVGMIWGITARGNPALRAGAAPKPARRIAGLPSRTPPSHPQSASVPR